jgi:proteasome lid subunit RPN8/RPN11
MSPRQVTFPRAVRSAIVRHARRDAPRECCGFLIGFGRRVQFAFPVPNADSRPRLRYRIDDRRHIELRRWLRQLSPPLEIVGVYHSHPNGDARPSPTDLVEAHYPNWVFAIVSLEDGRENVGLFEIVRGRARRLRV